MAEVFLARFEWARSLEKIVVVKRILPHLAEEPRFIQMFFAEAQLAAQLNHPNIVQIIEFGESGGDSFLAMEYIDGPSLRELTDTLHRRGERLSFADCARIVSRACEALAYAHDLTEPTGKAPLGLVHRDVSLDNILISKAGAVKLVDFGIAKATTQLHRTKTGVIKGKLSYLSPEQVRGEPLDRRADIYGLGVVLYELITGAKPFDATNEAHILHSIIHEDRIPLLARRPDVPPELERIVNRALERDRELRYTDCRVMHADLEGFLLAGRQSASTFHLAELVLHSSSERTEVTVSTTREVPHGPPRRELKTPLPVRMSSGVLAGLILSVSAMTLASRANAKHDPAASQDAGTGAFLPFYAARAPAVQPPAVSSPPTAPKSRAARTGTADREAPRRAPPDQGLLATLYEEGKILLKQKQYKQANVLFASCVAQDKRHAECALGLGASWARLGDSESAARCYREFLRLAPNHAMAKEVRQILSNYEN